MKNLLIILSLIAVAASGYAQTPVWVHNIGSPGNDAGHACKIAPNGNLYVTGKFTGTMDLDPGPGVYNITSGGLDDIFLACYDASGLFIWGFGIGGASYDAGFYLATDASSNVIICGYIQSGGIDFDPGAGVATLPYAGGTGLTYYGDGFVAKYSSSGVYQWAKGLGGPTVYDVAVSLATDPAGNVYVGGVFNTSMTISGSITFSSAADGTAYLIKYDPAGTVLWGHNFGLPGIGGVDCFPRSIQYSSGFLYVGGFFQGTSNFNPWGTAATLTAAGTYDPFIAKYDDLGNFVFVKQVQATGGTDDEFGSLSLDAADNIYVSGWTNSNTIVFDPAAPGTSTVIAPGGGGNYDVLMAKFNSSGVLQWGKVLGGPGNDISRCIDVSGSDLFCYGQFRSTVDFDPSPAISTLSSAGMDDIFVAKYDLNANYQCSFRIGSASTDDIGFGITHNPTGNIFITGQFGGTAVDFHPLAPVLALTAIGGTDVYIGRYIPDCFATTCTNSVSLPDTLTLCAGDMDTLRATLTGTDSVLTTIWSPPTGISDTTILSPTITATTSGYRYIHIRSLLPTNLIFNGDFSAGDVGFSTSYIPQTPAPLSTPGHYDVLTDPAAYPSSFTSFGDHTSGTGNMMLVDGGPVAGSDFWCQTIAVEANTEYIFSVWTALAHAPLPSINLKINGVPQSTFTTLSTVGAWQEHRISWHSGPSTTANICMADLSTAPGGNDFVIDDISLHKVCLISDSIFINIKFGTAPITGSIPFCVGSSITLSNTTTGGTWSCSPSTTATISSSGIVSGVAAGTATVTYAVSCGMTTTVVTVNPAPDITGISFVNPTCANADGSFTLSGLTPGQTYTVQYTATATTTLSHTADASGTITVTGLPPGSYSSIFVTNSFGCSSNSVGPVTLTSIGLPDPPTALANSPCENDTLFLSASATTPGVTYQWSGPFGFSATTASISVAPARMSNAGTYSVTVTIGDCTSFITTVNVTVYPEPVASGITSSGPMSCHGTDGWVKIKGLVAGETYFITYSFDGAPFSTTLTADGSGAVRIDGLSAGVISDIVLTSSQGCTSASYGPISIKFEGKPPPPVISHNKPCVGQTLMLSATDDIPGGTYFWNYPDGGTSPIRDHNRYNVAMSASGTYTVTYTLNDCSTSATADITISPYAILINVTPDQHIKLGQSIYLNADGATNYRWIPSNGTLNNQNINNPVAKPYGTITYTVIGTNEEGCPDSADVTLFVDDDVNPFIPSAFTPNGDGQNDIFRISNTYGLKLVEFSIYNRWGERVYFNTYKKDEGWDGIYKGVKQDLGVYFYYIILAHPDGTNRIYKGDLTLIR